MDKGHTIPVLDHGYVRLVDWFGTDERICEAARISYKAPSKGAESDRKLIHYLYKNKHTSPFEMVKITLNIKMPIFVMRQYVRHRMQNLNEVSARYTELPAEFYIPTEWRRQDTKNKQGSILDQDFNKKGAILPYETPLDLDYAAKKKVNPYGVEITGSLNETFTEVLTRQCNSAYSVYKMMLASGVAREMARMVLPVNIYTEIYCCWDLKNLLHFISLRDDSHAQAEIQEYGKAIKSIAQDKFPMVMEAYEKYKWKLEETNS